MINLLSSTAYLIVNKKLSQQVGLQAAALLADLISKQVYFENEMGVTDYFFNTQENIAKDTTLSVYQQRAALTQLKDLGLISVKLMGIPAKRHFKVNAQQVMQFLHSKEYTKPITINKNKEINNNNNTVYIRRQKFINDISLLGYDLGMQKEFTNYWCETNKSDTKMKWELQRTWDLNLRLQNWEKRAKQFDKPKAGSKIEAQLNEYNKGKKYL